MKWIKKNIEVKLLINPVKSKKNIKQNLLE